MSHYRLKAYVEADKAEREGAEKQLSGKSCKLTMYSMVVSGEIIFGIDDCDRVDEEARICFSKMLKDLGDPAPKSATLERAVPTEAGVEWELIDEFKDTSSDHGDKVVAEVPETLPDAGDCDDPGCRCRSPRVRD